MKSNPSSVLLILVIITFSSYTITNSQEAFSQTKALLVNSKNEIAKSQAQADIQHENILKMYSNALRNTSAKCSKREINEEKALNTIKNLKKDLYNQENEKKSNTERVNNNKSLITKFKNERCESNLLFIKSLREYMEAIEILNSLKKEVRSYFETKKTDLSTTQLSLKTVEKSSSSFLEKFAEYSHLLDNTHKQSFSQLSQIVQTLPQVSSLKTTLLQTSDDKNNLVTPEYYSKLETKIIVLVENLEQGVKNQRDTTIKNEIKASEDFALFEVNLNKENQLLVVKAQENEKSIKFINDQINAANLNIDKVKSLKFSCEYQKEYYTNANKKYEEYYQGSNTKRSKKLDAIKNSQELFEQVLDKLTEKIKNKAETQLSQ